MRFTFEADMVGKGDCFNCPFCSTLSSFWRYCLLSHEFIDLVGAKCRLEESDSYDNIAVSISSIGTGK